MDGGKKERGNSFHDEGDGGHHSNSKNGGGG
jgi:hypothetical protein